ncbi:MAG: hypothetical protein FJW39_09870 [Acidobacteria bacterium]|nr:hypothetical protein [Acidobacteriota bacterium]
MNVPETYLGALMLAALAMFCWGSWPNSLKMTGKWRWELYYLDFALGLFVCALVAAFVLGSIGTTVGFTDGITIASRKNLAMAMAAGGAFNLANMLLTGAVVVAGMSVALPIAMGVTLITGVAWGRVVRPVGNPALEIGGAVVVFASVVLLARAFQRAQSSRTAPPLTDKWGRPRAAPKPTAVTGVTLSIVAGILMSTFPPVLQLARKDDIELTPVILAACFAAGVLATTPFLNLYFVNLPVQGQPIRLKRYIEGTKWQHLFGLLGGVVWMIGGLAAFSLLATPDTVRGAAETGNAVSRGAGVLGGLWGLFYWKEFADVGSSPNTSARGAILLSLVGVVLIAVAPFFNG